MRPIHRLLVSTGLVLACGFLAHAATPASSLLAKLKQGLKLEQKTQRTLLETERKLTLTQLAPYLAAVKSDVYPPLTAISLVWPVLDYQSTVGLRVDEALTGFAGRMREAGIDFHALQPAATALPIGFTAGDGGCGDAAHADFLRRVDGAYAPLRKSVAKLAKALRTKSNIGLNVLMRSPTPIEFPGFTDASFFGSYDSFSLDFLASASHLGTANDGIVIVAGRAETGVGSVEVVVNGPNYATKLVAVDPSTGRFMAMFDNNGLGLGEGTYSVRARLSSGGAWSNWHIGVQ